MEYRGSPQQQHTHAPTYPPQHPSDVPLHFQTQSQQPTTYTTGK
jgi:hypothetical protein